VDTGVSQPLSAAATPLTVVDYRPTSPTSTIIEEEPTEYKADYLVPIIPDAKMVDGKMELIIEARELKEVKDRFRKKVVSVSFAVSDKLERYFKEHYPGIVLRPKPSATNHPHARLAFERKHAESDVVSKISKVYVVVDIGGNALRHSKAGRSNVWSCCPVLEPADAVRVTRYDGLPNWCTCKFQECNCTVRVMRQSPDVYLCIHSIYYLHPDDICEAVHQARKGCLYSVHHEFRKAYGTLAQGEASYMVSAGGRLRMSVAGNLVNYDHSACDWLFKGYYQHSKRNFAMSWSTIATYATSVAVMFVCAPVGMAAPSVGYVGVQPALNEEDYYGRVLHGNAFHNITSPTAATDMVTHVYSQLDIYSWGSFVLTVDTQTQNYAILPKPLISEMASWIAGKPRDPATLSALMARSRDRIRNYDIPVEIVPQAIVVSAVLGFVVNLENEMSLMAHVVQKHNTNFSTINSLLKFEMPPHIQTWKLLAAVSACFLATPFLGGSFVYLIPILLLTIVFWGWKKKKPSDPSQIFYRNFAEHKNTQESFTMPALGMIPLDKVLHKAPITSEIPLKPLSRPEGTLNPGPKVRYKEELEVKVQKETLSSIGLILPEALPVVHSSNGPNELRAIQNRAVNIKYAPSEDLGELYLSWLDANMDLLFPDRGEVTYNFHAWNSRYPPARRAAHKSIYERVSDVLEVPSEARSLKAFSKMEKLLLSGVNTFIDKDPRAIQGSTDEYSVFCGPWIWSFGKELAKVWNSKSPIFYASGVTPEEIGAWFEVVGHNNPDWALSFADFSRWDSSQNEYLLQGGDKVNAAFHVPDSVIKQQEADQKKVGATPHGVSYSVQNTVASGRHTTSCNNSSQHGCVILFNLQVSNPGRSLEEILSLVHVMVLGDDDVVAIRAGLNHPRMDIYKQLGLDSKLNIATNSYEVDFCSSYFWPTEDGIVLGPKPGRLLPKLGWYLNQHDKHVAGVHKATLQSLEGSCSFIPPLKAVVDTQQRILSSVRAKQSADQDRGPDIKVAKKHQASMETWTMLDHLYEWSHVDQLTLEKALSTVKSLPTVVGGGLFNKFIERDGQVPGSLGLASLWIVLQASDNPYAHLGALILSACIVGPLFEEVMKRSDQVFLYVANLIDDFSVSCNGYMLHSNPLRLFGNMQLMKHSFIWGEFLIYVERYWADYSGDPMGLMSFVFLRLLLTILHYHWAGMEYSTGVTLHSYWNFFMIISELWDVH
jgi:hypothetical protein